jgi:replicative DNA helicase
MLHKQSVVKFHEQLPPQHNLAEEIILGGILLNIQVAKIVIEELVSESFALETHQIIYKTIIDVYLKKNYVDAIILINKLWELNLLNKVGGINKILDLLRQAQIFTSTTVTDITVTYYLRLIQDKYIRRLLIQYSYNIIKLAYNSSITHSTIFFKTDRYITQIKQLLIKEENFYINSILAKLLLNLKSDYPKNNNLGLMSGFISLDRLTNGFKNGDLIVVAGRPSMGKTSFSLNIVFNLIKQKYRGISIFSLEMSKEQILYKLLSIGSCIPINDLKAGKVSNHKWEKLQQAGNALINAIVQIDDTANLSIMQLGLKAKVIQNENPCMSLVIIDYLQLLQLSGLSFSNRTEELSLITRSLKILAKDLKVPIIVLSQLNRNVESRINKKPLLADLRESGCIISTTNIIIYKKLKTSYCSGKTTNRSIYNNKNKKLCWLQQDKYLARISKTFKQYSYKIHGKSSSIIELTHNHFVLSFFKWLKNDQLKYFSIIRQVKCNTFSLSTYSSWIQRIHVKKKNTMYDMNMSEKKTFFANENTVIHNSIEQDADLVLLLYREAYYTQQINNDHNLTDIIIAKHRNGPTGTTQLCFKPEVSVFIDLK